MSSTRPPDPFGDDDLPTTGADIQALRTHRPHPSNNWLEDLTTLAAQAPQSTRALRERRTHAGLPPFEL